MNKIKSLNNSLYKKNFLIEKVGKKVKWLYKIYQKDKNNFFKYFQI